MTVSQKLPHFKSKYTQTHTILNGFKKIMLHQIYMWWGGGSNPAGFEVNIQYPNLPGITDN